MDKFDYKGYNEEKLLQLCSDDLAYKGKAKWYYWTAEVYSFGRHIRNYAFYPFILPLHIYTDHGVGYYSDVISKNELENNAYCQFYHSANSVELFKKVSNKPCYTMLSPFIMYRKKTGITKTKQAKGTLAFPAHTTPDIDDISNIENYIEQLKQMPEEFQPVCVCLHMHDIKKWQHKIFMKHNIPVYTAGNACDQNFAERFYNILKNFKYTTSNLIGSYTYYSVEMDMPFSIYGNDPEFYNNSDSNLKQGEYKVQENQKYQKIYQMFKGLSKEISQEQKEYVEKNLGISDGLSRFEMAKILYIAYFKKGNLMQDLGISFKNFKRYLRNKYKDSKMTKIKLKDLVEKYTKLKPLKISYPEIYKLLKTGYSATTTTLFNKKIKVNSAFWYLHGLEELFIEETYKFNAKTATPRIIDCGSNTGLSVIYFKKLFPKSKITAFEPDTNIFELLKENLNTFGYDDIELINKAVWNENGTIKFLASGGVGGRISEDKNEKTIAMPTFRLKDLLNEKIDFLKIDIEGAEFDVIKDCASNLKNVENLFIEYHSLEKNEQKLDEILKIMKDSGFKYYIKEAWNNQPKPYTNKRTNLFDLQLNIFGYRLKENQ